MDLQNNRQILRQRQITHLLQVRVSPSLHRRFETAESPDRRLRTYAMFCPLLPCIADSSESIDELIQLAGDFGAEEIVAEAVNPRGRGLILTEQALQAQGYHIEAAAIKGLRTRKRWSDYVVRLIRNIQRGIRRFGTIEKLRFLQYPSGLNDPDIAEIKKDDAGVVWLR